MEYVIAPATNVVTATEPAARVFCLKILRAKTRLKTNLFRDFIEAWKRCCYNLSKRICANINVSGEITKGYFEPGFSFKIFKIEFLRSGSITSYGISGSINFSLEVPRLD